MSKVKTIQYLESKKLKIEKFAEISLEFDEGDAIDGLDCKFSIEIWLQETEILAKK